MVAETQDREYSVTLMHSDIDTWIKTLKTSINMLVINTNIIAVKGIQIHWFPHESHYAYDE